MDTEMASLDVGYFIIATRVAVGLSPVVMGAWFVASSRAESSGHAHGIKVFKLSRSFLPYD